MSLVVAASLSLGAVGSALAAGNVASTTVAAPAIEVIVVKAKRPAPEVIEEIVITAKRPAKDAALRTPPAMPIEAPRLGFVVAAPPVVKL
jgi:hypothetical protein